MATVHHLPARIEVRHEDSFLARLLRLVKLELELGVAETRDVAIAAAIAVAVAVPSQVPLFKLVGTGARAVQAGLTLASTVAAVDRFLAERPARPRAA